MPGVVKSQHAVGGADVVKSCPFLVAEHHLRNPDLLPGIVPELEGRTVVMVCGRVETKPKVVPT